jgi:hypothetical protein
VVVDCCGANRMLTLMIALRIAAELCDMIARAVV